MPPRKRKGTADRELPTAKDAVQAIQIDPKALEAIQHRLKSIDAAVEERCAAITAAADEAVAKLLQELKSRLIGLPKKVRAMPYKVYLQTVEQPAPPAAAADAAAAFVDSKLEQMQQRSEAAATAAPTTRSLRSRARAVTAAPEPRTVHTTRTRAPVPKFDSAASQAVEAASAAEEPAAAEAAPAPVAAAAEEQPAAAAAPEPVAAAAKAPDAAAAATTTPAAAHGRGSRAGRGRTVTLLEPPAEEEEEEEGGEGSRQGAAAAAAGPGADARRAAAELRAKEKVDARLAAIGLAASTAVRGGGRTAMRAAQPGEACFSKNGSPLSIHPNITRARGRTGAARGWALMTPAVAAAAGEAAGPGGAMLGCFTLVKKGAAAATGRAGRSRAATAASRGAGAAAAQGAAAAGAAGEDTAMVITTDDGESFAVDAAGGLEAVPASHRQEVEAKLRAIQQFAATALRAAA